jgi:hypothetical protein
MVREGMSTSALRVHVSNVPGGHGDSGPGGRQKDKTTHSPSRYHTSYYHHVHMMQAKCGMRVWSWGASGDAGARAQHVGPGGRGAGGYIGRGGAGLQWARWFGWGTGQGVMGSLQRRGGAGTACGPGGQGGKGGYSGRGSLGGGRGRVGLRWDPGHGITAVQAQLRYRYSSDGIATVPL